MKFFLPVTVIFCLLVFAHADHPKITFDQFLAGNCHGFFVVQFTTNTTGTRSYTSFVNQDLPGTPSVWCTPGATPYVKSARVFITDICQLTSKKCALYDSSRKLHVEVTITNFLHLSGAGTGLLNDVHANSATRRYWLF